jgi:hypothetical protein
LQFDLIIGIKVDTLADPGQYLKAIKYVGTNKYPDTAFNASNLAKITGQASKRKIT